MSSRKHTLLVTGTSAAEIQALMPLAHVLAASRHLQLRVAVIIHVPADQSLSVGARAAQELRRTLHAVSDNAGLQVHVTHDPVTEVQQIIAQEQVEMVVASVNDPNASQWLRAVTCDMVLFKGILPKKLSHILLPIRGGPFAALALECALVFANECAADITLLQALPPTRTRDVRTGDLLQHLESLPQIARQIQVEGDALTAILDQAKPRRHQMLVMGAASRAHVSDKPLGPIAAQILDQAPIATLIVQSAEDLPEQTSADTRFTPVDYTISVVVDKWFAQNTFHAHEFQDIRQLVALKEKQGLTISLGLPTLNEQETIGSVIKTMRKRFVREYPLLDEIVVIDSNSTDRTVEIVKGLGVRVVKHPDVLAQYGTQVGKGEALWHSLYVLKGDLIAWIDTDIVNIHPRFVYGILGPLIREPHLMYVKGFYQRPLRLGKKVEARGGGRVTELTARPLLNLFYPELSGFVQPLAGEYAGRRAALEQVPFIVGYGVETGLLIDLLARYGLDAMGQVDLEERVHRSQSLHSLSKMAFEITQVVMQRVGKQHNIELVNPLNRSMKLIRYEEDGFDLDVADIQIRERPPMITIPEYRKLRKIRDWRLETGD